MLTRVLKSYILGIPVLRRSAVSRKVQRTVFHPSSRHILPVLPVVLVYLVQCHMPYAHMRNECTWDQVLPATGRMNTSCTSVHILYDRPIYCMFIQFDFDSIQSALDSSRAAHKITGYVPPTKPIEVVLQYHVLPVVPGTRTTQRMKS